MRRLAIASLALLALAACDSKSDRHARFVPACTDHEFTAKQCELLFSMQEKASDDSDSAALMGGVAIGMSAGKR